MRYFLAVIILVNTVPQGAQPLQVSQWQFQSVQPNLWPGSQPTIIAQNGSVFLRGKIFHTYGFVVFALLLKMIALQSEFLWRRVSLLTKLSYA